MQWPVDESGLDSLERCGEGCCLVNVGAEEAERQHEEDEDEQTWRGGIGVLFTTGPSQERCDVRRLHTVSSHRVIQTVSTHRLHAQPSRAAFTQPSRIPFAEQLGSIPWSAVAGLTGLPYPSKRARACSITV